jgi:hypothetical protein
MGAVMPVRSNVAAATRSALGYSLAAVRRRIAPVAPDVQSRDWLDALEELAVDDGFFALRNIAAHCRYVFDRGRFVVNEPQDNDWYFCKTDHLEYFFAHHAPHRPFVLFSGHSDASVDGRYRRYLRRPELRAWFATNATVAHPRLRPLPVGVANPLSGWPNANRSVFHRVRAADLPKTRLFYVRFEVHTNPRERERCLRETRLPLDPPREFPQYLEELASAYFCVSPSGLGIDCHRTWEALHLKTIPVVRRSLLTEHHRDFPIVVLDDWADFHSIPFTPELHRDLWGGWDRRAISLDGYLARTRAVLRDLDAG